MRGVPAAPPAPPALPSLPALPIAEIAEITAVEVRLLTLPTSTPLVTAHNRSPDDGRQLVVIKAATEDGVVGWGECSALNRPTYTAEWAGGAFELLSAWADDLFSSHPSAFDVATNPMAAAGIEMALLDAGLRQRNETLTSALGKALSIDMATRVLAGATLGLLPVDESVEAVRALVDAGYRRVKVKVGPEQVDAVPHELSHSFPDLDVQVDGNGSLDERHMMDLLSLAGHGVTAIEQPFAVDRADLAAEFAAVSEIPLIADESVSSIADAASLSSIGALGGISIKPPRVGGLTAALELLVWCRNENIPASVGGMLECGLGRHALAAFAACEGFTLTGDVSPARHRLDADPWPDIEMIDGWITVPTTLGVAPPPDLDVLDQVTIRHVARRR